MPPKAKHNEIVWVHKKETITLIDPKTESKTVYPKYSVTRKDVKLPKDWNKSWDLYDSKTAVKAKTVTAPKINKDVKSKDHPLQKQEGKDNGNDNGGGISEPVGQNEEENSDNKEEGSGGADTGAGTGSEANGGDTGGSTGRRRKASKSSSSKTGNGK